MRSERQWRLTDFQRLTVVLASAGAFFIAAAALGSGSWILFLVALGLAAAIGAGVFLLGLRYSSKPLTTHGDLHVIRADRRPRNVIVGRCDMEVVIDAPGSPISSPTVVKHREYHVPVIKWPRPGMVLPIVIPPQSPRQFRVIWDQVQPHHTRPATEADESVYTKPVHTTYAEGEGEGEPAESGQELPTGGNVAQTSKDSGALADLGATLTDVHIDGVPVRVHVPKPRPLHTPPPRSGPGARPWWPPLRDAGSDQVPDPALDPGPDPERKAEAKPGAEAEPEAKPEARSEAVVEPEAEPMVIAGPEPEFPLTVRTIPQPRNASSVTAPPATVPSAAIPPSTVPSSTVPPATVPSADAGPPGAGVGIMLFVSDLERSLRFYRDVLDFSVVDDHGGNAVLSYGGGRVLLRRVVDMSPVDRRLVHLHLEVPDLDGAFRDLRTKGIDFVHRPRVITRGERLELWAATFRDPDGHAIALTEWRQRASVN